MSTEVLLYRIDFMAHRDLLDASLIRIREKPWKINEFKIEKIQRDEKFRYVHFKHPESFVNGEGGVGGRRV